jgi:hypothetical protein
VPGDLGARGQAQCHAVQGRAVPLPGYRTSPDHAPVNGRYGKVFTAHAGDTADTEYACAYLLTPNSQGQYQVTAAHASSKYYVTN